MKDPLGDRMKATERFSAGERIHPENPLYVRLDGRGFSRFTKGMQRPFDPRMTAAMKATATHLLEATHANAAYVQSDEISLLWSVDPEGEHLFGGKPQKLTSVLAGLATAAFTRALLADTSGLAQWADRLAHFDARAVAMGDPQESCEMFAWRGKDARRNGINQLAQSVFSNRALHGISTRDVLAMLAGKGIDLDDYPAASLNGTLLRRIAVRRALSETERAKIPQAHRPGPDQLYTRHMTVGYDEVHPGRLENLEDVLFDGAEPVRRAPPTT